MLIESLLCQSLKVRNAAHELVPLDAVMTAHGFSTRCAVWELQRRTGSSHAYGKGSDDARLAQGMLCGAVPLARGISRTAWYVLLVPLAVRRVAKLISSPFT
jgi:hypothetical protein